jgi:hypothetical protein
MTELPDIAISYVEGIPSEFFDDFVLTIKQENLDVIVFSRPESGAYAALEWFLPTMIAAYISKSYFDGFLKEMGKDHYQTFKNSLASLTNKTMSHPRIEPLVFGSEGKVKKDNPYSLAFSIYAEANDGKKFKLLIPKPNALNDYTDVIYSFLEFLSDYHGGIKQLNDIGFNDAQRPPSDLILVHMNLENKKIEWVDFRNL